MMEFGIFRRMEDKLGELLLHFDEDEVKLRILERIDHRLPLKAKKGLLKRERERKTWSREEIGNAFQKAWNDVAMMLKKETIRIQ